MRAKFLSVPVHKFIADNYFSKVNHVAQNLFFLGRTQYYPTGTVGARTFGVKPWPYDNSHSSLLGPFSPFLHFFLALPILHRTIESNILNSALLFFCLIKFYLIIYPRHLYGMDVPLY